MPATAPPPIETKSELQARLAAIEAEEHRIEGIHNSRVRLRDGVAKAEARLAAARAMLEKLRASAAAQWAALTANRIESVEEIVKLGLQVGDIDGQVPQCIGTEFQRAMFSDFRISRANEKWLKPLETALADAQAALADFEKANPVSK